MGKYKKRKNAKRYRGKWHEPSGYNVHHRLPKSRGGSNDSSNLSTVPKRLHNIFNELFGSNPTAHEVAQILTDTWIDPAYEIIVRLKKTEVQDDQMSNLSVADVV